MSSHLVLSVANEEWKKKGIMTWSIHEAIMQTKKNKLDIFDSMVPALKEVTINIVWSKIKAIFKLSLIIKRK